MGHEGNRGANKRWTFARFGVFGYLNAILLSLALVVLVVTAVSDAHTGLAAIALAPVAIGVAVNCIRRAIAIRRYYFALARSRALIKEFDRLDAADDDTDQ